MMTTTSIKPLDASFRDPSGFLFREDNILYRLVNKSYKNHYDLLMSSGLYEKLVKENLLIPHREIATEKFPIPDGGYKIIAPEIIPFISYPYEWCFSQLKDAALVTLNIQRVALEYGMILKDASAFNIQFYNGSPLLIDTLSFEKYPENEPWVAYRQFCRHFLAPLALMSFVDVRLNSLFLSNIDGIPLPLAGKLLPVKTLFNFSLLMHIHLHGKLEHRYGQEVQKKKSQISKKSLLQIIDNLTATITKVRWKPGGTEWGNYYEETGINNPTFQHKVEVVDSFLTEINPPTVWDMGANTGIFSRLASDKGIPTISFDVDPAAVEKNYLQLVKEKETKILPLVMDISQPTPAIGWKNKERMSFSERGQAHTILALALVHHLVVSGNLSLEQIAEYFARMCQFLIIEFVPVDDPRFQQISRNRKTISPYGNEIFERSFTAHFNIVTKTSLHESGRILYLLRQKEL